MKRGDVVIVPGQGSYRKVRPAVIVQADAVTEYWNSIIVCPVTSHVRDAPFARITIAANAETGLKVLSQVMVDKITTYPRDRVRGIVGRVDDEVLSKIEKSLLFLLSLFPISTEKRN